MCELKAASIVYWRGQEGVDTSCVGTVLVVEATDPEGIQHTDVAEVVWADGIWELASHDELERVMFPTDAERLAAEVGARAYQRREDEWKEGRRDA